MKSTLVISHGVNTCNDEQGEYCWFAATNSFGKINTCRMFNNYPLERNEEGEVLRCSFCINQFGPINQQGG